MGLFKRVADRLLHRAESRAEQEIMRKVDEAEDAAIESITKVKLDVKGKMVKDFKGFKTAWERKARQPENSVLYYLIAAHNASNDTALGEAMASLILPTTYLLEDSESPSGYRINSEAEGYAIWDMWSDPFNVQHYLGGEAKDDYKIDEDKLVLKVVGKAIKGRAGAIVITSADKDTQVTCTLKRNKKGQWKIFTMESADVGKVEEEDF